MFTDIVGSTELASSMGDRSWKQLVARHHSIVRRQLKRFAGRELDTAGDGFFVMFERPAQAIDCAWAVIDALRPLDIQIRAAVHMGEVEVMGGKVGGIAVHAASRVLGLAEPGTIYVTGIVHDVVAGSDIRFAEAGVHHLRGVPGDWHLFAVADAATDRALPIEAPADPRAGRRRYKTILAALGLGVLVISGAGAFVFANFSPPGTPQSDSASRLVFHGAGSAGNDSGLISYLPPIYGESVPWPLLVFIHGYEEAGDGSEAQLRKLFKSEMGIPSMIETGDWPSERPFVVLMPQISSARAQRCQLYEEIASVIDWAERTYRIDPERIYLTGIGCGATGVWEYLAREPDRRIAAAVPISGAPKWAVDLAGCKIGQTPIWLFHGALNDIVPVHFVQDAVNDVRACPDQPSSDIEMTLYPDAAHYDAWMRTYDGSAGHDVFGWMLGHRLSN